LSQSQSDRSISVQAVQFWPLGQLMGRHAEVGLRAF